METEIIHHGNNNLKRKVVSCGAIRSDSDSTNPSHVNCLACIQALLRPQAYITKKSELWAIRLKELKIKDFNDLHEEISYLRERIRIAETTMRQCWRLTIMPNTQEFTAQLEVYRNQYPDAIHERK